MNSGGNQLPRMDLVYIREFTKRLIKRPQVVAAAVFSTKKIYADQGSGGGVAPTSGGDSIQITIPNNGTATYSIPKASCQGFELTGVWKRSTTYGDCVLKGWHDGTNAEFRVANFRPDPGFNEAGFGAAISGSNVVLTFAADNSGNDIVLSLTLRLFRPIA